MNSLTQLFSNIDELQPRKVEELVTHFDVAPDTYLIYPGGGYHLFYGISNTAPRYQLPVWPYVKRIKFHKKWTSQQNLENARTSLHNTGKYRHNFLSSQVNPSLSGDGYPYVNLVTTENYICNDYTKIKKDGKHSRPRKSVKRTTLLHRLVAKAWIPNPSPGRFNIVMHDNDDSTNYLIENLRWGTRGQNMKGKKRVRPETMEQKYLNLIDLGVIKG